MNLTELLDTQVQDLEQITNTPQRHEFKFRAGDDDIYVNIHLDDYDLYDEDDDAYTIEFGRWKESKDKAFGSHELRMDTTGDGDALKIFSGVIAAIKIFLKSPAGKRAQILYFTADKDEKSRSSLYSRLIKKYANQLPNFTTSISNDKNFGHFRMFTLKRVAGNHT